MYTYKEIVFYSKISASTLSRKVKDLKEQFPFLEEYIYRKNKVQYLDELFVFVVLATAPYAVERGFFTSLATSINTKITNKTEYSHYLTRKQIQEKMGYKSIYYVNDSIQDFRREYKGFMQVIEHDKKFSPLYLMFLMARSKNANVNFQKYFIEIKSIIEEEFLEYGR